MENVVEVSMDNIFEQLLGNSLENEIVTIITGFGKTVKALEEEGWDHTEAVDFVVKFVRGVCSGNGEL